MSTLHRPPSPWPRSALGVVGVLLVAGTFGPGPNVTSIPSTGQIASIAITAPPDGTVVTVPAAGPQAVPIDVQGNVAIGSVAGNPINVLTIVDVSGSTGSPRNQDCNGDGVVNSLDDFNNRSNFADTLDCEISGVIALNQSLFGFANLEVGLVRFNSGASTVDVNPMMPGIQDFTSPAELDLDNNGMPDLEQAARQFRPGGGTSFRAALASMNTAFSGQPAGETNVGFLLSDGFDGSGFDASSPELVQAVAAGTIVNTFSVGTRGAGCGLGSDLRTIADATGGTCTEVLDPSQLASELPGVAPALLDRVEVDGIVVPVDALGNFSLDVECPSDDAAFDIVAEAFFNDVEATTVAADIHVVCEGECPFSVANPASLGAAAGYNAVVFGDYTGGLDVEGAVAVARDATFSSFSVGYGLTGGPALVAGRDLTLTSGTVGGDAIYGNVASVASDVTLANGGTLSQGAPIDFATLETELVDLSVDLASLFPTDPTQVAGSGGLALVGSDAALNVFQVTEAEIEGATSLLIQAPATSAVVVNVAGSDLDLGNFQWTLSGVTAGQVIVNLFEATTADLTAVGIDGTLLAPLAHVTFSNGDLEGTLVAKQLTGSVELYDTPFVGVIDECPAEPPPAVASCEADYHIVNAWPTNHGIGYQVQVTFSHTGAPLSDWQLTWRYPGDDTVQHLWNGVQTQSGADVTVTDAGWNGSVAVGQAVGLGFIAGASGTYPTLPPTIELNGVVCD